MADREQWQFTTRQAEPAPVHARNHRLRLVNRYGEYLQLKTGTDLSLYWSHELPEPRLDVSMTLKELSYSGPIHYEDKVDLQLSMPHDTVGHLTVARSFTGGPHIGGITCSDYHLWLSKKQSLTWKFTGQQQSLPLMCGEWFGLYNETKKAWLVYCELGWGPNKGSPGVMWYSEHPPKHMSSTVWLKAEPPYEGPIPYIGRWPVLGNPDCRDAYLERVDILAQYPGLVVSFPKADTNQFIPVAEGNSLSASQMKEIFGSEKPRLPVNFRVYTSAPASISQIVLNIGWWG